MNTKQQYLPEPSQRRSGIAILGHKYIVCHDTGNDGSTAQGNVNYYIQSAQEQAASAHTFVDDIGAIECIPETEKAWHVRYNAGVKPNVLGSYANDWALGVELCFGSAWTPEKNLQAYHNYCEYIAGKCFKYNLDPKTCLFSHGQLDPTRRTDPVNAFGHYGKTWAQFILDVVALVPAPTKVDPLISIQVPQSKVAQVEAYLKTLTG